MDVKAGTTVGFVTVLGGAAGAIAGLVVGELANAKHPGNVTAAFGAVGALVAAFVAGSLVAPTPVSTSMVAPSTK
jgi:uncharacterized membrane protein YeaQ/YmgE (transglycosylase-associated protein family)